MILSICEKCNNKNDNSECKIEIGDTSVDRAMDSNYLNTTLKKLIVKVMREDNKERGNENKSKLSGCIEYKPIKIDIPHLNFYDHIIDSKNEFDFINNNLELFLVLFLVSINIIANLIIYTNFAIFSKTKNDLIFLEDVANETILFPVMATFIVLSAGFLYKFLVYNNSVNLARYIKYIGLAQTGGFFGLMTKMFWAAIFSWTAFVVFFFISFDISHLKPDKASQIERSKLLKEQIITKNKSKQDVETSKKKRGKNNK